MPPFTFELQPADCLVFSHSNWLGKAIQHATHSEWSHAAVALGPRHLIEAHDLEGVRQTEIDEYLADPTYTRILVCRPTPPFDVDKAVAKALSLDGRPYAVADLVRIYLYEHCGLHGLDCEQLDGEKFLICSEVCCRVCIAGGKDMLSQWKLHTPGLFIPAMVAGSRELAWKYDWKREVSHATVFAPAAPAPAAL